MPCIKSLEFTVAPCRDMPSTSTCFFSSGSNLSLIHIYRSEHYIPENMNPIFKYPLRLDGIIISIREKGSAKVNINLREYDIEQNDLIICAPGDILQSMLSPGIHLSQMFLISSDFLKEMYINLNSLDVYKRQELTMLS